MLSEKAKAALVTIRYNIHAARQFLDDMTVEEFRGSKLRFYAVMRALEIISEAARRLPEDFRLEHPSLPWKKIMGVGNVYRHDYDNVQEDYVWSTVRDHLEPLLAVVTKEIEAFPTDP